MKKIKSNFVLLSGFKDEWYVHFDFIKDENYKKLNKTYKSKYAIYQLGLKTDPTELKFSKIKKFTKDGKIIIKHRRQFSTSFIFNIVNTEAEARLICEVWK